jgi:hypothetical protein
MQLLIVFISYLIVHSTCFERHPLIIRSFLYCTYSLQLSVLLSVRGIAARPDHEHSAIITTIRR